MEKNLNPSSWSDLPPDLLNSVFERLSFVNFQRAKSVCSSWHSASRQCVPKNNQILPWLIIFPEDNENNNSYSCTLINPEEKDKRYRTQDLGLELAKSFCIAIYGNWLLIRNPLHNLYILNLFSNERINLPPVESQLGTTKMERTFDDDEFRITGHNGKEYKGISIRSPVFWIDEKTKDYVVLWLLRELCVVYSKKGDTSWSQIPDTSCRWCHMVYKDSKLYYLSFSGCFFIFDLSGEIPLQTFRRGVNVEFSVKSPSTRLVVTITGDVLMVEKMWSSRYRTWSFRVFKVYSSSGFLKKRQLIDSLGDDEAMLLDQGITVLATDGFIRNCIYFSVSHRMVTNDIFLFNLKTQKTEPVHIFDWSSIQFSRARRFFPSFSQT